MNQKNVSIEIEKKLELPNSVSCVLYFEEPMNKIFTFSWDSYINSYDSNSLEFLKKIKHGVTDLSSLGVQHMIKWDYNHILVGGDYHVVTSYLIDGSNIELERRFELMSGSGSMDDSIIYRLLKLNDDQFLVGNFLGEVSVISYSQKRILRKVGMVSLNSLPKLVLSRKYMDCFYINTISTTDRKIKLINYENCKLKKEFNTSPTALRNYNIMYSIEVFVNNQGVEILICGGYRKKLFFYDTRTCDIVKEIKIKGFVYFNRCIKDKYLVCGDRKGYIYIINLMKKKIISRELVHKNRIFHICILDISETTTRIATGSFDQYCNILRVKNTTYKDILRKKQSNIDLFERIGFVLKMFPLIGFEKVEKKLPDEYFKEVSIHLLPNFRLLRTFLFR